MAKQPLNYNGIDLLIEELEAYLQKLDLTSKEVITIRLMIEEILLKYVDHYPDDELYHCDLSFNKRFGQERVLLKIKGPSFDPNEDDSDESKIFKMIMQNQDSSPVWKYRNNENQITLTVKKKKKRSIAAMQLGAIAAGIVLGFLLKAFISAEKILPFCESFLDPVNNAVMGLLGAASVFFIFFSVMNGICNMGDIATFNKIGTKMFKRIIIIMLLSSVVVCAMSTLIFPIASGSGNSFEAASLWQMLVSIIPVNFIEAFSTGNTLQISFLAIMFGIIILLLGEKGERLSGLIFDLSSVLMELMQHVIEFLPVPIFISIFEMTLQGNIRELTAIYKYPLYFLIFCALAAVFFILRTCIIQHLSVKMFFQKVMPVSLIAFITASSSATIAESYKACEKKLGIENQFLLMGWPINNTFLSVNAIIDCIVGGLACAEIFHIPVSLTTLIVLGLNVCLLAMAVPKIPGAMVTIYTLVFGLLGVPSTALSLIIPLQFITDRITTGTGSIILHTELIRQAAIVDRLDEDILHSEV